jgi:predicted DNA-binding ribbon-helix-helix protein
MSAKWQKRTFLGAIANDRKIATSALVEEIKRDSDTRNLSSAIRPGFRLRALAQQKHN